jgi:hypothetical protein
MGSPSSAKFTNTGVAETDRTIAIPPMVNPSKLGNILMPICPNPADGQAINFAIHPNTIDRWTYGEV